VSAQAELLKLQKIGQFPDEPVRIKFRWTRFSFQIFYQFNSKSHEVTYPMVRNTQQWLAHRDEGGQVVRKDAMQICWQLCWPAIFAWTRAQSMAQYRACSNSDPTHWCKLCV
jgi:hypothetical protein